MSRTYKDDKRKSSGQGRRQYQLSVRAVRRDTPDLRKLARPVIQLAMAEAEAEAAAQRTITPKKSEDAESDRG